MSGILAAAGPSPLWYLTRGAGAATLLLLTASVVLGILNVRRWRAERWPRFVLEGLHRNISMLVLVVLALHILTTVLDSFAPVDLKDAIVPFVSRYRPIWVGFGALALDLLLALVVTSLLRQRLGHTAWRRVHWLAYASWPVALVHGLGTGTDATATWFLALSAACLVAVWVATWVRVRASSFVVEGWRTGALSALTLGPLALAVWLPNGPLGSAWARRAGTPAALLPGGARVLASRPKRPALAAPFTGRLAGTVRQGEVAGGLTAIRLHMSIQGRSPGVLDVRIEGPPVEGGGVSMTQSDLMLGPRANPTAYRGQVASLDGNHVVATASDATGRSLRLDLSLVIDSATQRVQGTISAQPAGVSR